MVFVVSMWLVPCAERFDEQVVATGVDGAATGMLDN